MKHLLSILIISSTFLFSIVTNDGATLTIDNGVSVFINGEFVNNGTVNNEGYLQFNTLSGSGEITGSGTTFDTSDYTFGDVNFDDTLNILDIVRIIAIIFDTYEPNQIESTLADLNNDGIIDVLDIVVLVDLILPD